MGTRIWPSRTTNASARPSSSLEDEGWTVEGVSSGEGAIEAFERQSADVVLIDIMLPGIDGFELCRTIRRHSDVPIVMVTARNDTHDIVAGLEAGADDYLTKPFAAKELSARIRALLRRVRPSPRHAKLVFGDLELIPEEGKVLRNGRCTSQDRVPAPVRLAENPARSSVAGAARQGLGLRLLRRRRLVDVHVAAAPRWSRRCQPAPRRHRARPRVPPPDLIEGRT